VTRIEKARGGGKIGGASFLGQSLQINWRRAQKAALYLSGPGRAAERYECVLREGEKRTENREKFGN